MNMTIIIDRHSSFLRPAMSASARQALVPHEHSHGPLRDSVGTPAPSRTQQMLHGPLLPTLLRLATPNIIGLFAMTVVIGYDGYVLGRLGADALAGIALVFPLSMLMMQMSGGGIGGAVTAAVARALGAGGTKTPAAWRNSRC